ncbi:MAG: ATP-binding protein [Nakamurella sp.]
MTLSESAMGFDLYNSLAAAIARRSSVGWVHQQRAADALAVIRSAGIDTGIPDVWPARFGLDDIELSVLAVVAAVERDVALHLLIGLLAGDPGPGRPTPALVLELAGVPPHDPTGLSRFGPLAPLRRNGLLILEGADVLLARRLRLPDRVAAQLRDDDLPTPTVLQLLTEPIPVRVAGTDAIATALVSGEQIVWVHAPAGTAGTAMAAGACRLLDHPVLVADLHRVPAGPRATTDPDGPHDNGPDRAAVAEVLPELVLEAALTGSVLVVNGAELAVDMLPLLQHAALPVIGVSQLPWNPAWTNWLPASIEAPRLTVAERSSLWESVLPGVQVPKEIAALRLTPEQMWQVARRARTSSVAENLPAPDLPHLMAAARRFGRGKHAGSPGVTIHDLVLPRHARREVGRLLDWARYRDEVMAQGALQGKGGKGTGICALFAGSPGTGKTLAAHVVADTLGIELLRVELSSVVSKYIGESEKNLERVFAEAESLNSVLFFDEADALFGARSGTKDAHDRYANQEISYLLQRMESFDGITILATNLRGNLDPAFGRRLHFIITFPDPDAATRSRLWQHHLAAVPALDPADPIDTELLAGAAEIAGGDIRNVVLAAVYDAVAAGERVGLRHIGVALSRELGKLGRRVPPVSWLSDAVDSAHAAAAGEGRR